MTFLSWSPTINGDVYDISLEVTGRTVEYTCTDVYADRGGTTTRRMGLRAGREKYAALVERFGQPQVAYCTI